jgi:DNA-damage-inducible protein D
MAKEVSKQGLSVFEQIKRTDEQGNEFWSSRDLSKVMEYSEYRHFIPVIERAKEACKNSGQQANNHFEDILEMVAITKQSFSIDSICFSSF